MNAMLQITIRDVPHSGALDAKIREKAEKLEKRLKQKGILDEDWENSRN